MITFRAMSRCLLQCLSPRFERLCHKLPKILPSNLFRCKQCTGSAVRIHHHHVDCNEAKGTASTKMGETAGGYGTESEGHVRGKDDGSESRSVVKTRCLFSRRS